MATRPGRSREVDEYVSKLDPGKRRIVNALRKALFEAEPGVAEAIEWGRPAYNKDGNICHIDASKECVRLEFSHVLDLTDPPELVDGSWADQRHTDIRSLEDVRDLRFRSWIVEVMRLHEKHSQMRQRHQHECSAKKEEGPIS